MQRDLLLLGEPIDAAEQIKQLAADVSLDELDARRERRDALLWNYTVLGEAAGQVSDDTKGTISRRRVATADATPQPHRARVLVDRPGDPAYDRTASAARTRRRPPPRAGSPVGGRLTPVTATRTTSHRFGHRLRPITVTHRHLR